jgi:cytochrome c556
MRKLVPLTAVLALTAFGGVAQEAEDPFADIVETRHGLMLQMASDLQVLGGMAKGETAYDAATATRHAANVAAIASVLSMQQFPEGSETGKAADSFAKAEIWSNQEDFLTKVADLNTAAAAMQTAAGTDAATLKTAMGALGGACAACHKAYRQPEG